MKMKVVTKHVCRLIARPPFDSQFTPAPRPRAIFLWTGNNSSIRGRGVLESQGLKTEGVMGLRKRLFAFALSALMLALPVRTPAQRTQKPPLHGRHWMAITGKPLGATAGAMVFQKGGNAVDAACAMLAATATLWDTLSWGGETQALIYNAHTGKGIGVNALRVAPTGATAEFYKSKGMRSPPEYGPFAAVTPGTPGGLMTMLAEYGKLS